MGGAANPHLWRICIEQHDGIHPLILLKSRKRKDSQLAALQRKLDQINAAITNKKTDADQICRLANQKSVPWKRTLQVKQREIAQKQQQQKSKQQKLRNLPAENPSRDSLEADILTLGLEIATSKETTVQLTTRISSESASCTKAQQAFTAFSTQQNANAIGITEQINGIKSGNNAPIPDVPVELSNIGTYYSFPLEPRRTEFMARLGCGQEQPNLSNGNQDVQPTLRATLMDASNGQPNHR